MPSPIYDNVNGGHVGVIARVKWRFVLGPTILVELTLKESTIVVVLLYSFIGPIATCV